LPENRLKFGSFVFIKINGIRILEVKNNTSAVTRYFWLFSFSVKNQEQINLTRNTPLFPPKHVFVLFSG